MVITRSPSAIAGLAIAGLACLVLAGCSGIPLMVAGGLGTAGSLYSAVDRITQAADPVITRACGEYEKGKAAADTAIAFGLVPRAAAAKVATIESFGDAACANPPSGDPLATAIWLGQLAGQVTTLTLAARAAP